MNSIEINFLLRSLAVTRKHYVGCYPIDGLPSANTFKHVEFSLVVNLDVSTGPGTHWCAIYFKNGKMFYFDSFGRPPPKILQGWFRTFVKELYYNRVKHQALTSMRCGGFCCWLIYEMSRGKSFTTCLNFLNSIDHDDDFIKKFMKSKFNFTIE